MPRKKLARRFEPRGGVSQSMLDAESRHIVHEIDDYLLLSITDLREQLASGHKRFAESEEVLQRLLSPLADRERLALRCILVRDAFHLEALFVTYLQSPQAPQTTGTSLAVAEELTKDDEPRPALPFTEWLFDP